MTQLDRLRRDADANGDVAGLDAYQQQAFGILTSSKLADALDLEREDPALRDRYGRGSPETGRLRRRRPAAERLFPRRPAAGRSGRARGQPRLWPLGLARPAARHELRQRPRSLAGARPGPDGARRRSDAPRHDRRRVGAASGASSAARRGSTRTAAATTGRTSAARSWPAAACATGQVIGATNRLGEHATDRPVHFQEVFATLYHNLGIDVNRATVNDLSGRPHYLVDHTQYQPLREVI